MKTPMEAINQIRDSIGRGKGTFTLTHAPAGQAKPFNLSAGSIRAIQVSGGFIVSLGLSRDQVATLRDICDALLADQPPS
jgi:hypothetical protein